MRTIITYLAIAALLLCPYDCAVKLAAAQASGSETRAACCEECLASERIVKTSDRDGSPADQVPAQPRPSEDGKSCLCEGAVFDATARSAADAAWEFSFLGWVADVAGMPRLGSYPTSVDPTGHPPNREGGRLTRIAIGSLLL
jgi:hypothetical protein